MKRGEIWWVCFEPALGSEIRKVRPAVILSNDVANQYLSRVVVVPLTSKTAKVYPGECLVMAGDREAKAMADQILCGDVLLRLHGRVPSAFCARESREAYGCADRLYWRQPDHSCALVSI